MKTILFASAALATLSMAGTAGAADMRPAYKAPPPVVQSWTGCYLGAGGGYGMWRQDTYTETFPVIVPLSSSTTSGGSGWFGTVQGGCDYQFRSNWLVGAFADYDFGSIKGQYSPPATVGGNPFSGEEKMSSAWAAGGRIGWLPFDRLLTFFSAGYTEARFDPITFFSVNPPFLANNLSIAAHTYRGWFVGAGYEYALGWFPGLNWKTEYRYASYKADDLPFLVAGVVGTAGIHSQKSVQTVRSELVWRFNPGALGAHN